MEDWEDGCGAVLFGCPDLFYIGNSVPPLSYALQPISQSSLRPSESGGNHPSIPSEHTDVMRDRLIFANYGLSLKRIGP